MSSNDQYVRKLALIVSAVVVTISIAAAVASDLYLNHLSCVRTYNTRHGLIVFFRGQSERAATRSKLDSGYQKTLDLRAVISANSAITAEHETSCGGIFSISGMHI